MSLKSMDKQSLHFILASFRTICCCLFFLANQVEVSAHDAGEGHAHLKTETYLRLMADIADLTPEIINPEASSHAVVSVAGERVALNGALWTLARSWVRVIQQEANSHGPTCMTVNEAEIDKVMIDHSARGFFELKITEPLKNTVDSVATGSAKLGARLGQTALVAKVSSEIAETILSKAVGGAGVHIACNLFDAVILLATRHLQSAWRALAWSDRMGQSRWTVSLKQAMISRWAYRALKRVEFVALVDSADQDTLKEIDEAGPNRWWGWVPEGKRSKWVHRLGREGSLELAKKDFLGSQVKRFLWLKSRQRGNRDSLRDDGPWSQPLNRPVLWILAVQEGILEKSLAGEPRPGVLIPRGLSERFALQEDEIRRGLVEEFTQGGGGRFIQKASIVEELLKEIEVIFSPKATRSSRYMQVVMLEAIFGGLVHHVWQSSLDAKSDLLGAGWADLWRRARFHFRSERFMTYLFEWFDFLRLAALEKDPEKLAAHKYESMEVLLRVFKILELGARSEDLQSKEDVLRFEQDILVAQRALRTFTPWREKRIEYTWLPWKRSVPWCEKMHDRSRKGI